MILSKRLLLMVGVVVCLLPLLAACSGQLFATEELPVSNDTEIPTTVGKNPVVALPGAKSTEAVALAKEDLAQRLDISPDSIDVIAIIGQQFPVDAFYCGTTKERVARDESPATIEGQTILLRAVGHKYEYHVSDKDMIFCRRLR